MKDQKENPNVGIGLLHTIGFIKPIDYVFLAAIVLTIITGVFWCIFAHPAALNIVVLLLTVMCVLMVWILSMVYRVGWFILQTRAAVEMVVEDAARVTAGYLQSAMSTTAK